MRHRFYTNTSKAIEAMRHAISEATTSIFLEMYILEYDAVGSSFVSTLEQKAHEGIRVILILDAIGSFNVDNQAVLRLKKAGAEVFFFSYWLKRTHRKLLIIDEHIVFLGGVNISGRFSPWKDLQVRLSGKRLAQSAVRSFARVYKKCGGMDADLLAFPKRAFFARTHAWFQEHGVNTRHRSLRAHYESHIDKATHSIIFVTPYLFPRRWFFGHLHTALLRGVEVTIIVPAQTDHLIVDRINRFYLDKLNAIGVVTLLSPSMNHAKVMLIDHKVGTIGTHNLDILSFDWNIEASIFFDSPTMIRSLTKIIERWKNEALPYKEDSTKTPWYEQMLRTLLCLIHRLI